MGGLTLAGTPLHRLSPRTMLNVLLLCCGLLQGIQAILTTDLSCGHLQKVSGGLEGADRARYSGLLRKVKEVSAEPVGKSCGPPVSCCPPAATRWHAQSPKMEVGTPHPGSDAGDPLKAAQLLLSLASESSLAAHREWGGLFL